MLTSHGLIELAVKALKQGAVDFLEKPFSNEKLVSTVQNEMDTVADSNNLYEVEKRKIIKIIERHSGNITHAAAELGIGRNTLYRKMRKYDL